MVRVTHGVHAPASFLGLLEVFLLEQEAREGGRQGEGERGATRLMRGFGLPAQYSEACKYEGGGGDRE